MPLIRRPAPDFAEQLKKLDQNKSSVLHCVSGCRSTGALPQFAELGFSRIVHLAGGLKAWQQDVNPVTP